MYIYIYIYIYTYTYIYTCQGLVNFMRLPNKMKALTRGWARSAKGALPASG